jgi:hypothetical protein
MGIHGLMPGLLYSLPDESSGSQANRLSIFLPGFQRILPCPRLRTS